jgi:hypothetical protein
MVTVDGVGADMQSWLQSYFGDLSLSNMLDVASADPDGDGLTNAEEFLAQTDPTDVLSALRMLWAELGLDDVTLEWSSSSGCVYSIEMATDLGEEFETVRDGIPATPPVNRALVPRPAGAEVFFRIILSK